MKYCIKCLQPDTRPGSYFTNQGLCPACDYYFNSNLKADWEIRFELLKKELKKYKKNKNHFDCIIGISGGKDSTRQAIWARDKLGLNPLLVCLAYPPEQVTERGAKNLSNLIELGFDVLIWALQPQTWKKALKSGFINDLNWAKASEQAIISSVPQIAIKYNIKLIFWGENPGLQLGDMKTVRPLGYDGNNLRNMNTVKGGKLDWMIKDGFHQKDLIAYRYPTIKQFEKEKLQIIYMGWFWDNWSIINNGTFSSSYGLELREDSFENTGDLWGCFSLDEDWVTLNQMIKYYKFGFGRVNDYCNEGIRHGTMTREEGINLIENYEGKISNKYIEDFCRYIEISETEFWDKVKSIVNKDLFTITESGKIIRKFKVGIGL